MNWYQYITFLTVILCTVLSVFLMLRYEGSKFHKIYGWGIAFVGLFVLTLLGFSVSRSEAEAWMWTRMTAVVHFIPAISLHATLTFSVSFQNIPSKKKLTWVYIPFLLFFFQDLLFPELTYATPVQTQYGWASSFKTATLLYHVNMVVYFICITLHVFLLLEVQVKSPHTSKKRFSLFVLISYMLPMIAGFIIAFLLPFLLPEVLRLEVLFAFLACVGTICSLYFFNVFDISLDIVSKDVVEVMSNFLIILDRERNITFMNSMAKNLLCYKNDEMKTQNIQSIIGQQDCIKIFDSPQIDHQTVELFMQPKNSPPFPAILSLTQVIKRNDFLGFIIIGSDVSNIYNLMEEKKIAELELKALLRQMNPHFLFNSLNSVQYYINQNDEEKANEYLSKFGLLMRNILEVSEKDRITLAEEIQNLEIYLSLESSRFSGKFSYRFEVDPSLNMEETTLPPMIIQPFVENAIWHGILPKPNGGEVIVYFEADDGNLICTIVDNGIGREKSAEINKKIKPHHRSTAIKNIEDRIQILNKQLHTTGIKIKITDLQDQDFASNGTKVQLFFPHLYQTI